MKPMPHALRLLPLLFALAACEQLGIEDPAKAAASKEAEGKAIGSACRHAMRAIEDCYTLNPKASKAAVYQGWREMDEYMRENKLEGVAPVVPRGEAKKPKADEEEDEKPAKSGKGADKESGKDSGKAADKSAKDDKPAKH